MRRAAADIAVALAAVVAGAVLLFVRPDIPWVRVSLGLPLVLLLPGAALASLADREKRLEAVEWLTLSVAASIGLAVVAGMALGASVGLTADGLLVTLVAATLVSLLAAYARSSPEPEVDSTRFHQRRVAHLALGLVGLLALGFLVIAVSTPGIPPSEHGVVQLWGLPDGAGGLRLGARNIDAEEDRYVLTVRQGDQTITQQRVVLPEGATHIFEVKQTAIITTSAPVAASLADEGGKLAERTVLVWSAE